MYIIAGNLRAQTCVYEHMKYYKFMLVQRSKEGRHGNAFYIEIFITHGTNYCLQMIVLVLVAMIRKNTYFIYSFNNSLLIIYQFV